MAAIPFDTYNNSIPQHQHNYPYPYQKRYRFLDVVNKGSYGVVYRAWDNKNHEIVAMKHEFHGLSQSTLREIAILKSLPPHPSIVELKKVVVDEHRRVLVVMEFLPTDLKRLMDARPHPFSLGQVKLMMRQIVEGINFLHHNGVMHRDLKPANILINERNQLKICDFGLSRHMESASGSYTPGVVTQVYRAPELLLGEATYSSAIDMWSVGCIMAELLLRRVLFLGNSEIQQLNCIYQTLGASCNLLRMRLADAMRFGGAPVLSGAGFDLLLRLLELDPNERITAKDALNHAWFAEF